MEICCDGPKGPKRLGMESPEALYRVYDASRWEAECPMNRLSSYTYRQFPLYASLQLAGYHLH